MGTYFSSLLIILAVAFPAIAGPAFDQTTKFPPEIVEGVERQVTQKFTVPIAKDLVELPVEKKNPDGTRLLTKDGKRQFELRLHNEDGVESIVPVTAAPEQETMDNPSVFYFDARQGGEIVRHEVYAILPPEQQRDGRIMQTVIFYRRSAQTASPQPQNQQVPDGVYHSGKYPVHADKDAYNRFFYHITVIEGRPPLAILPRVDTSLLNQTSKATYPGRVLQGALGLPNYYANILNTMDYTSMVTKRGDRWRDWMIVDAQSNITYFQFIPAFKLQKGKDGAWDIHVSKEPPALIDIRKTK